MSGSPNNQGGKEKKPVLTHFLCLPLVNETSLPRLEASLGEFEANIPPRRRTADDHPAKPRPPLFPDAALRPLGTLHLTLGVMSLPTPERLDAALKVLQSLDLTSLLREAGVQSRKAASQTASSGMSTNNDGPDAKGDLPSLKPVPTVSEVKPQPLLVSLEGLHALPKARSATVLYASPVDPTSRLYPFGVLLRDKFLEAGLIEGETKKTSTPNQDERATEASNDYSRSGPEEMTIQQQNHPGAIYGGAAENVGRDGSHQRAKRRQMPKSRPLLLHATVVNTVYVRSSRGGGGNRRNKSNKGRRHGALTFDARDIIAHYKDYYMDEVRTKAKPYPVDSDTPLTLEDQISGDSESSNNLSSEEEAHPSSRIKQHQRPRQEVGNESDEFPFIWASNLSIDKVCICEMGAQKLDAYSNPLAMRLGQEYRVVAERSLMDPSPDADGNGDGDREEGGVSL
jgi:activating signal cointegrator complex subunit 1